MSEHNFWATATEIGHSYARGDLSPVELVEHVLQRAEHLQPHLNFLVLLDREGALAAARAIIIDHIGQMPQEEIVKLAVADIERKVH